MKKAAMICPDHRAGIQDVIGGVPLVLAVYLGKPLIDHALYGLARQGMEKIRVFVSDRPAEIRDYLGNGAAWGLQLEVIPTPSELSMEELGRDYGKDDDEWVMILDRLPQAPSVPILENLASWHSSRVALLPWLMPGQIGARELSPGVWVGMKVRLHPGAVIASPAWIGHQSMVGDGARIGPCGFVENGSFVEVHAEVKHSTVGARTYLGGMTHLSGSIACGSVLANYSNGSVMRLTDAFLLSPLDMDRDAASGYFSRLIAALALLFLAPFLMLGYMLALIVRKPWLIHHQAILRVSQGVPMQTVGYADCPMLPLFWSRWPRLWRVVTGHFSWIGNPPLAPDQVEALESEFEFLWLHVPPAIFTAPEAEGCRAPWDEQAYAHAALFASRPTLSWRCRIFVKGMKSLFFHPTKNL